MRLTSLTSIFLVLLFSNDTLSMNIFNTTSLKPITTMNQTQQHKPVLNRFRPRKSMNIFNTTSLTSITTLNQTQQRKSVLNRSRPRKPMNIFNTTSLTSITTLNQTQQHKPLFNKIKPRKLSMKNTITRKISVDPN